MVVSPIIQIKDVGSVCWKCWNGSPINKRHWNVYGDNDRVSGDNSGNGSRLV